MDRKLIVKKIAAILHEVAPEAISTLYGSEARGEAHEGSDIDLLIVLPDDNIRGSFASRKIEITGRLYDIELESGVTVSPLIVLKSVWQNLRTPFTINVAKDGIPL